MLKYRVQLGDGLKTIVNNDYPERWPSLLPSIDANLKSQNQERIYGALYALRILTRKYELDADILPNFFYSFLLKYDIG